jgi:DNA-binding NarL/FixJ family response regulator
VSKLKTDNFSEREWNEFLENCCFTDNELEVVACLKRGFYVYAIAGELSISEATAARRKKAVVKKITRYLLEQG